MEHKTLDAWLGELANRTPTPGGGAAAALSAAVSAALIGMVTAYTTGRRWADREMRMRELGAEATKLRTESMQLANEDAEAFTALQNAYKLSAGNEAEMATRADNIQRALVAAADPPCRIAVLASRLVQINEELSVDANPNILSDVAVAASSAKSALESAIINMEVNNKHITDEAAHNKIVNAVKEAERSIDQAKRVITSVRERLI